MIIQFDRIASVLFLAIGVLFIIGSQQLGSSSYGSAVGPDIFPLILGSLLVLLSIRLFYETFLGKNQQGSKEKLLYKPFLIIFISDIVLYFNVGNNWVCNHYFSIFICLFSNNGTFKVGYIPYYICMFFRICLFLLRRDFKRYTSRLANLVFIANLETLRKEIKA